MNSTTPSTAIKPRYPGVSGLGLRILASSLFQPARRGSFRADALPLVGHISPPLRVLGAEWIPRDGPCLVLTNHYYRPGFDAWWLSLAVSSAVPVEIHWVITAELTYPGQKRGAVLRPLTRFFLGRVAKFYGFFAMPAMPPDPRQSQQRSATIRRVMGYIRQSECAVIGLAPEGRDIGEQTVGWPPLGAGRFVRHLAHLGLKLYPVGAFEQDGALCVQFGPPFALSIPEGLSSQELDRAVSRQVMQQIERLLPATFSSLLQCED